MESACGPIDREFTINQHFEQPLQPLKGISIKNIYSMFTNCPIPPLQIYGNLKGYLTKIVHAVSLTPQVRFLCSDLGEFKAEFKKAVAYESGPQGVIV
jgi:hypothetical protein